MAVLVQLGVNAIYPHPDNPRKDIGDITELADSIKANGIFQNLTVVRGHWIKSPDMGFMNSDYTVIIGHRRLAAAKQAGIETVPCIVADMSYKEQIQTMLLENMQRSNLTAYEQAQGFQRLLDFGATIDEIAEKSGFSKTTVRRRVKMMELNQDTLKRVSAERQLSLGDFDALNKIEDIEVRNRLLEQIGTHNFNYSASEAFTKQERGKKQKRLRELMAGLGVKEIERKEIWNSRYHKIVTCTMKEEHEEYDKEKINVPHAGKLYFAFDWGDTYALLERSQKPSKDKDKAAAEKQAAIANAWSYLKEQALQMSELRADFIKGLNVTASNAGAVSVAAKFRL